MNSSFRTHQPAGRDQRHQPRHVRCGEGAMRLRQRRVPVGQDRAREQPERRAVADPRHQVRHHAEQDRPRAGRGASAPDPAPGPAAAPGDRGIGSASDAAAPAPTSPAARSARRAVLASSGDAPATPTTTAPGPDRQRLEEHRGRGGHPRRTPTSRAISAIPAIAHTFPGTYLPRLDSDPDPGRRHRSRSAAPHPASIRRQALMSTAYIARRGARSPRAAAAGSVHATGLRARDACQFLAKCQRHEAGADASATQRTSRISRSRTAAPPGTSPRTPRRRGPGLSRSRQSRPASAGQSPASPDRPAAAAPRRAIASGRGG